MIKIKKVLCWLNSVFLFFSSAMLSFGFSNNCEELLNNSPKFVLIEEASRDILISIGVSSVVSMLHKDKEKRPLGIITGMGAGILYTTYKNGLFLLKNRGELSKTYRPPYLQISKITTVDRSTLKPRTFFKEGEYIMLVIRHILLDYAPEDTVMVRYVFHLYRDYKYLGTFEELVPLIQGETANLWLFPVCPGSIKGKYRLKLEVIALGQKESGEVEWEIR